MSVHAIGQNYQNQTKMPAATVGKEEEKAGSGAEINRLNAEIKQAESEMKETAKEVQKAMGKGVGGSSEKVQLLQNKMQMQQQAILMTQMKIKEIESSLKTTAGRASKGEEAAKKPPKADTIELSDFAIKDTGEEAHAKPAVLKAVTYKADGSTEPSAPAPTLQVTA